MLETIITLPLVARAAPILLPLAATLCKHLLGKDETLFTELIGTLIDESKDATKDRLEEALKKKPDLVLALNHQVFMNYTGWVLGALIRQFGRQPQFAYHQKDLERFADQAPEGWITFVLKGSPGLTPVHQDVFLRQMAESMARDGSLPSVSSVPFTIFFNWHIRLPVEVQQKLDSYLKTHLDNALQVLLLSEESQAQQAYKQIILNGIHGIKSSLSLMHRKFDATAPVIVETNQTVKAVQQQSDLILGQLADALKGNNAESRITQYKRSLLAAFRPYQELALDNYASADQACPDIWDIFVHPACSQEHLRPEDMDAAQRETLPRLPTQDLLPILGSEAERGHVLLADPGMGKSTLIQALIAHLASGRSFPDAKALNGLLPVPLILRDLVPLLPQDQPDSWTWDNLITVLLEQYQREETAPLLLEAYRSHAAEFRQLIHSSDQVFFLIDGLDEIGDVVKRRKIVQCVQDGIRAVNKGARWLITSRVIGYENAPVDFIVEQYVSPIRADSTDEEWERHGAAMSSEANAILQQKWRDYLVKVDRPDGTPLHSWLRLIGDYTGELQTKNFSTAGSSQGVRHTLMSIASCYIARRLYIAPFDDKRQDDFTSKWFKKRHSTDHSKELMREVRAHHHDGVRIISRVPNLLCMMNMLKRSGKPLPDGRAALYDEIVKAYLGGIDSAYKFKPILGNTCPFEVSERRHLLSLLGAHMQQIRVGSSDASTDGNILISMPELAQLLVPAIETMQQAGKVKSSHRAAELLDELLHHIASRSGLLIPRSSDEHGNTLYSFTHLSFLEFFAAEWLAKEFDRQRNRLARRGEGLISGQTFTDTDLDHDFPPIGPIQHLPADFPKLAASPVWHEPLIFLVESRKSDTATLLRWLFPELHSNKPYTVPEDEDKAVPLMPLEAVRLVVQLAHDQELSLSPETRRHWWRTLWCGQLLWPHAPWHSEVSKRWQPAPLMLQRLDKQAEIIRCLAEVHSQHPDRTIFLSDCHTLTSGALVGLQGLRDLKVLSLDRCTALEDTSALVGLIGLRTLTLQFCTGLRGDDSLSGLQGLKSLEMLHLGGCTSLESLPDLSAMQGLKELYLGGCTGLHGPEAISGLSGFGQLETLDLSGCIGLESLPDLSAMQGLNALHLRHCSGLRAPQALSVLSGLRQLELLELYGCTWLESLPDLSAMQVLKVLDLRRCIRLRSAEAFKGLTGLGQLQTLNLIGCTGLTEADVEEIRKMVGPQCQVFL